MDAHYHVTDMKVMRLRSQETLSGRKEYIVVGTMATFGEELSAKGKVNNICLFIYYVFVYLFICLFI